jgi:hypothetical protein
MFDRLDLLERLGGRAASEASGQTRLGGRAASEASGQTRLSQ